MEEELLKLKGDKKIPTRILLRRTMKYVKPEWISFVIALILLIANVVLDLYLPLVVEDITNNVTGASIDLDRIIRMAIIYFVVMLVTMGTLYLESMLLQRAGQRIIYNLRIDVFTHIENMSQHQFDEMPVGSLVTRVASYTQSMSDFFTNVIVRVIKNVLYLAGVLAVMFYLSVNITLFMLISVVLVAVSSFIFSKAVSKRFRTERRALSDLNTYLNENLSGMKITQIFNQEDYKINEFKEKNDFLRKSRFNSITCFALYRPFITLVYIISVAVCFYLGFEYGLLAGAVVAYYMYLSKFFKPIQELADELNQIQKALTASKRLFNLMDVMPEVRDKEDAIDIEQFNGKIEFKNVWFAYKDEDWILRDVSFVINPKETCAFIGATGAGKTTILGLIVRNYEIQKGQILIDDVDITNIKLKSLRRAIGQMLQDVFLFSGTIRDNITLHDTSYPDEKILDTCKYVNDDSFISKLPKGLDEEVIERGENFSQ